MIAVNGSMNIAMELRNVIDMTPVFCSDFHIDLLYECSEFMTAACGFTAKCSRNSYCDHNSIVLIEDYYQKSLGYRKLQK